MSNREFARTKVAVCCCGWAAPDAHPSRSVPTIPRRRGERRGRQAGRQSLCRGGWGLLSPLRSGLQFFFCQSFQQWLRSWRSSWAPSAARARCCRCRRALASRARSRCSRRTTSSPTSSSGARSQARRASTSSRWARRSRTPSRNSSTGAPPCALACGVRARSCSLTRRLVRSAEQGHACVSALATSAAGIDRTCAPACLRACARLRLARGLILVPNVPVARLEY